MLAEVQRSQICEMWRGRLKGVQRNVEVWQALLSVRTLVLPMHEDTHTWLKFASLCRKSGRIRCVTHLHVDISTHTWHPHMYLFRQRVWQGQGCLCAITTAGAI